MKAGPLSLASDATADWLVAAVAETGIDLSASAVANIEREPLGIGRGNLGGIVRLTIELAGSSSELPGSLVLKFAPANVSSLVRSWRLGRREASFYRTFGGVGPMPVPRCYFAAFDDRNGDFTLLLEDLGAAATADQEVGASRSQAEIAVDHLAHFHAHFWENPALEANADWLRLPNANREAFAFFIKRAWRTCAERYPELPTSSAAALASLDRCYGGCLDRVSAPPTTLLHGDFRLDNMFFESDTWQRPFAVADWQLVGRGRGPWDLAHFIVGSMTAASRIAHAPALIRRYHAIIEKVAGARYPFEDCMADYDAGMLGSFAIAAVLVDAQLRSSGALAPVMETWLRRSAAGASETLTKLETSEVT